MRADTHWRDTCFSVVSGIYMKYLRYVQNPQKPRSDLTEHHNYNAEILLESLYFLRKPSFLQLCYKR